MHIYHTKNSETILNLVNNNFLYPRIKQVTCDSVHFQGLTLNTITIHLVF